MHDIDIRCGVMPHIDTTLGDLQASIITSVTCILQWHCLYSDNNYFCGLMLLGSVSVGLIGRYKKSECKLRETE